MADAPRWRPSAVELDDVELALLGVWSSDRDDDASAVSIVVPGSLAAQTTVGGCVLLVEEEGVPYAALAVTGVSEVDAEHDELVGRVTALSEVARGSHRPLRRAPSALDDGPGPVLGVPVDGPLPLPTVVGLAAAAERLGARLRLLPLTGHGRPRGLDGSALVRSCLAVRPFLGADVVPVALADHDDGPADAARAVRVASGYHATWVAGPVAERAAAAGAWSGAPELVELPEVVLDARTGRWATADTVPPGHRADPAPAAPADPRAPLDPALFDAGTRRELLRAGTRGRAGVVVLFTGLSGSGKSTIARTLQDRLLDRTDRTVTLLDGDVVRQMLSSELSFSREHRVLNVRRIGFVASTIAAHGGIALCSPIAPYESTRCEVRAMVEQAGGGFVLVHVATPLEVCESRDRKGLYARARAGTVREFTGISDPYETPYRPDLTVDTSSQDVDEAVDRILAVLVDRGWTRLLDGGDVRVGGVSE